MATAATTMPGIAGSDAAVAADAVSAAWPGKTPEAAVVVSCYQRAGYVEGLTAALAAQDLAPDRFEVVLVDNGSVDGTWDALTRFVSGTRLRARAVSLPLNRGPGGGRNAGVAASRAPVIAFTDDDCLAEPGWIRALLGGLGDGDVVQGAVRPVAGVAHGPWDRSVAVNRATPFFETASIAYRRRAFLGAGGFDVHDEVTGRVGRAAFGEDALLGAAICRPEERRFAADAVVCHRWIPGSYRRHLRIQRDFADFPALARRSPVFASSLLGGCFIDGSTAAGDAAVASVALAAALRRPALLLGAAPWLRRRWPDARARAAGTGRWRAAACLAQLAGAEAVAVASRLQGSVRHRRLVL